MAIASLSIDITARVAELQRSLDEAGRIAERNARQIETSYSSAAAGLKRMFAVIAPAVAADAIVTMARNTLDAIDKLNDLADATGSSVEKLSGLEDVALRTGNTLESASAALVRLNKVLQGDASADETKGAGAVLAKLGLDAEQLRKIDPADALVKVSVALRGFADDGEKARGVMLLTGKSIQEIAPLLKDLGDAGAINAKVTTEQARAAEELNNQLKEMAKNSEDARRSILLSMVPAINELFREWKAGKETLGGTRGGIKALLGMEGADSTDAQGQLKAVTDQLNALTDKRIAMEQAIQRAKDTGEIVPGANAFGLVQLNKEIAAAQNLIFFFRRLIQLREESAKGGVVPAKPSLGHVPAALVAGKAQKDQPFFVQPLNGNLQEAIKLIDQSDPQKAAQLQLVLQELIDMRPADGAVPGGLAAAIASIREQLEKLDPAAQQAAADAKLIQSLIDASPQGQLRELTRQAELLHGRLAMVLPSDPEGKQQLLDALDEVYSRMDRLSGNVEKTTEKMDTFAKQAAKNIESSLADTLYMSLSGRFDSILDLWKNMLMRMAAEAASAQLSQWLFGGDFAKTGNVGGAIGDLLKLLKGSGVPAPTDFQGGFAAGGFIPAGRWGIVGERGPEIARGPATIEPMTGRGGVTWSPTIVVQGEVGSATVGLVERMMARERARWMREFRA